MIKHLTVGLIGLIAASFSSKVQAANCFQNITIEPGFVAFTTSKQSKLDTWYQNLFGMEVVKEFAFPDGSITGSLIRRGDFVVEFFKRDDVLLPTQFAPTSRGEQWAGVMKFGVYTDANLPKLQACLKASDVEALRIFNDENLGIDLLLVRDPESNMLEIISRQ